jgi:putative aldouronate transport system permease protein
MESAQFPAVKPRKLKTPAQKYIYSIVKNWQLYAFIAPAVLAVFVFSYMPLYGIQMAFKDFNLRLGIAASPWADPLFRHFSLFMNSTQFYNILRNTLTISIYGTLAGFPIPILLAIMLNEMKNKRYMKVIQNVTYAPHFISMVVIVGMINLFFSQTGMINQFLGLLGVSPTNFLMFERYFIHLFVWSGVWQSMGFASIIYFAALSGVSPELHEAAIIDGASRLRRIWHINLPHILPTIIILLILEMGRVMNVNFERVYLMQTGINLARSEVLITYVYKLGIIAGNFSLGSAVNLFNNVINMIMLIIVNFIARKTSEASLF